MLSAVHAWSLTAIAIAAGIAMLLVFRRFSHQDRIRAAKRKIRAHLYSFRLYADEPAMMFRAQKQLLLWNVRYIGLMLPATAVIAVPMLVLLMQLDAVYGRRPLHSGESAIVSARLVPDTMTALTGEGIAVETPPVRVPGRQRVYWRIRALTGASGAVILHAAGPVVRTEIQAGSGLRYLSERPVVSRFPGGAVPNMEVGYPAAKLDIFGAGVSWIVWFILVSSVTMLAFRKRFRVTF